MSSLNDRSLATRKKPLVRHALQAGALIGGLIGFVAGVVELVDYVKHKTVESLDAAPLIPGTEEIHIAPGKVFASVTIANRILVDSGEIHFPENGLWIANEIIMKPDTVLQGDKIAVVAKLVRNGRIDASGDNGIPPGGAGEPGGEIFIAAKTLEGVKLFVRGGDGADGQAGPPGPDGRSGKCKGFGGYRMATAGADGGNGGHGGNGGAGGLIVARLVDLNTLVVDGSGGNGGGGGPGGQGGRGGSGCTGLGGSQPTKANGLQGKSGSNGKAGVAISPDSHAISYEILLEITQANIGNPLTIVEDLRKL